MQAPTSASSTARARLEDLAGRMDPGTNRSSTLKDLDELFRSGSAADPLPDGFQPGRLIGTSIWSPLDALVARIASVWMPWQGKTFDREASGGVNRFDGSARVPLKVLFPTYRAERDLGDLIEAFPFRNRVAPGELDPDVQVYKIDYDFEANPRFIIRHILDELVQIDDGLYLGKILYRTSARFHPIGFFSLERVAV
ncbi:MAG TPA: hypothetical protein VKA30_12425 [Actinomycetota bacterium]|nr:hypothetical protein [Actinomycetota bacterium]